MEKGNCCLAKMTKRRAKPVKEWMYDAFLPQGYPHTVSSDYLNYQLWDSLQVRILYQFHAYFDGIYQGFQSYLPEVT